MGLSCHFTVMPPTSLCSKRTCPRITETSTYKRRKQVGRKQDILASLPGEQVHYRLDDLTCPDCRHELKEIDVSLDKSCCTFQPRSRESITSSTLTSASTAVMKHRLTRLSRLQSQGTVNQQSWLL